MNGLPVVKVTRPPSAPGMAAFGATSVGFPLMGPRDFAQKTLVSIAAHPKDPGMWNMGASGMQPVIATNLPPGFAPGLGRYNRNLALVVNPNATGAGRTKGFLVNPQELAGFARRAVNDPTYSGMRVGVHPFMGTMARNEVPLNYGPPPPPVNTAATSRRILEGLGLFKNKKPIKWVTPPAKKAWPVPIKKLTEEPSVGYRPPNQEETSRRRPPPNNNNEATSPRRSPPVNKRKIPLKLVPPPTAQLVGQAVPMMVRQLVAANIRNNQAQRLPEATLKEINKIRNRQFRESAEYKSQEAAARLARQTQDWEERMANQQLQQEYRERLYAQQLSEAWRTQAIAAKMKLSREIARIKLEELLEREQIPANLRQKYRNIPFTNERFWTPLLRTVQPEVDKAWKTDEKGGDFKNWVEQRSWGNRMKILWSQMAPAIPSTGGPLNAELKKVRNERKRISSWADNMVNDAANEVNKEQKAAKAAKAAAAKLARNASQKAEANRKAKNAANKARLATERAEKKRLNIARKVATQWRKVTGAKSLRRRAIQNSNLPKNVKEFASSRLDDPKLAALLNNARMAPNSIAAFKILENYAVRTAIHEKANAVFKELISKSMKFPGIPVRFQLKPKNGVFATYGGQRVPASAVVQGTIKPTGLRGLNNVLKKMNTMKEKAEQKRRNREYKESLFYAANWYNKEAIPAARADVKKAENTANKAAKFAQGRTAALGEGQWTENAKKAAKAVEKAKEALLKTVEDAKKTRAAAEAAWAAHLSNKPVVNVKERTGSVFKAAAPPLLLARGSATRPRVSPVNTRKEAAAKTIQRAARAFIKARKEKRALKGKGPATNANFSKWAKEAANKNAALKRALQEAKNEEFAYALEKAERNAVEAERDERRREYAKAANAKRRANAKAAANQVAANAKRRANAKAANAAVRVEAARKKRAELTSMTNATRAAAETARRMTETRQAPRVAPRAQPVVQATNTGGARLMVASPGLRRR
jgi:hypothetical protein